MWDCSVTTETRAPDEGNRPDLQIIDQEEKRIDILEMACPSWRNRAETSERKTRKYQTVRDEMRLIPRIRRESDKHHSRYSGRI